MDGLFNEKNKPLILKEIKAWYKKQQELNPHLKDAGIEKFIDMESLFLLGLAEWASVNGDGNVVDSMYYAAKDAFRDRIRDLLYENEDALLQEVLQKIDKLEAKLRNHRHNLTEKISGKAEY